ncbi:hypothetical protein ACFL1G_02325 [Planctomycetota bacterium]
MRDNYQKCRCEFDDKTVLLEYSEVVCKRDVQAGFIDKTQVLIQARIVQDSVVSEQQELCKYPKAKN